MAAANLLSVSYGVSNGDCHILLNDGHAACDTDISLFVALLAYDSIGAMCPLLCDACPSLSPTPAPTRNAEIPKQKLFFKKLFFIVE